MPSYIEICEEAVRAGGSVLIERFGRAEVYEKGRADLVTDADFASQDVVRRIVQNAFPDHALLGEEDRPDGPTTPKNAEFRWIVDPLDGTTNYVHQVPHFAVSLALERAGELLVGAVYDPMLDEFYSAVAGEGALLNGTPIHASEVSHLSNALAAFGFPAVVQDGSPDLQLFLAAMRSCQAMRRTGSASLNLCYLAAGRFDAAWSYCTKIWDVAAGVLLIREAGGVVSAPDGGEFVLSDACFLAAANTLLHAELRSLASESDL